MTMNVGVMTTIIMTTRDIITTAAMTTMMTAAVAAVMTMSMARSAEKRIIYELSVRRY